MPGKQLKTLVDEHGRVCTKCMSYKTWDLFYKRSKPHGLQFYHNECKKCTQERQRPANTRTRRKAKQDVLVAYGRSCACCGETEPVFLTIDHIDGNGAEHRRQINNRGGSSFYYWLRQNGYPEGYQVLCWNCNSAKHINGTCPHALTGLKEAVLNRKRYMCGLESRRGC